VTRADSPLKGRLIFALGCRRSGTNWLQRILAARPDVVGMPTETHLFSDGLAPLEERFQHTTPNLPKTAVTYMSRDGFVDALRDFADRVFEENMPLIAPDAHYLVERTPWHVYHVGLIAEVYPDAPIVHIIRDGRDVARSLLSTSWGPDTMEGAAEEWRSSVVAGRSAGASLPRYVEVFYERLLSNPEAEIRSLYERLELEMTPEVMERVLIEADGAYNVDPLFPKIGSGKWRTALSPSDLRTFDRVAGELLEELGYQREPPPAAGAVETLARTAARIRAGARAAARPRRTIGAAFDRSAARRSSLRFDHTATMAQRIQAALGPGSRESFDELLTPDARVRIVDAESSWSGRGDEATARLREFASAHEAVWAHPIAAVPHPGADTFTVVGTYGQADGAVWSRTLVLTFGGERISSVALYNYPVAAQANARTP
jgi:hypothetical protein